jgi:hypothetical protein
MASDFYGRSYLVESESLLVHLIRILRAEVYIYIYNYIPTYRPQQNNKKSDSVVRRNALGAL